MSVGRGSVAKGEASIRVYLPPEVKDEFKRVCFHLGVNMSDVAADLIHAWLKKNRAAIAQPYRSSTEEVKTLAALVRQHFYELVSDGAIASETLQAIAQGKKPSAVELKKIATALDLSEEELIELLDES